MASTGNARQKNWKLTGQTGWLRDDKSAELLMEMAFILTTTDDGIAPTEKL